MYQIMAPFIFMLFTFIVAQIIEDNSIVDIAWGPAFVSLMCLGVLTNIRTQVLFVGVIVWALRLSTHIATKHKGEDFRYTTMRKNWTNRWDPFFRVFMLQAALVCIVGIPLLLVSTSQLSFTSIECIGLIVFIFGFVYESYADYELSKRKEKIYKKGLWSLSRHPNYFGEIVLWWGIGIFAIRDSILALLGPLTLTLVIRYITMPLLEEKYKNNKAYQKYARTTPAIIPKLK